MKEIELIGKRGAREKHFLKENGIITANVYDEDIHFLKDGKYEEIDNTLIEDNGYLVNKNNAYKVSFAKKSKDELMEMSIGNNYIKTMLVYQKEVDLKENITQSQLHKNVCYPEIIDNVDLEYNVMPGKVKEAIILKNKNVDLEKLIFLIRTNTKLELKENKKIVSILDANNCFEFDVPYMVDANFKTNNNVNYKLNKIDDDMYELELIVDKEWLNNEQTKYPVIIDPTITNSGQNNSVYDTYIYPGDSGVDRNSQDILKAGVEKVDGTDRINRTLLKFELPTIGTGSQVISASIELNGYPDDDYLENSGIVTVHQVTTDWNETTANWNTMNDKYNSRIECAFEARRGYYDLVNDCVYTSPCGGDITNLVRKWYTGTPNYGIMIKQNKEVYDSNFEPAFFSKNNNSSAQNPKPILIISYRNQNGIENYMDYQTQNFINGDAYVNTYNGNLTTIFGIGKTIGGKIPVILNLIYNTNDVVLGNDIGYGLGYRLNLHQTIKEQLIDGKTYLEYTDEDGTLHYFINEKVSFDDNGYNTINTGNIFYDEDGMILEITKNDNYYVMKDKNGNIMKFIKNGNLAYLSEIQDINGNKNIITYDSNKLITKIVDADNSEININYVNNSVNIIGPDENVTLNYLNNQVISINGLFGETIFEYNENKIISKIIDLNNIKTIYEYYDQKPYKVKKVSEYGSENNLGEFFEMKYGFDSTTIIDSKGKSKNIIFNSNGSIKSTSSLKQKDDVKNAYGISEINGTDDDKTNNAINNKSLRTEIPLKYVKNFLTNTSFEENKIYFNCSPYTTLSITDEEALTGTKSLKIVSTMYDDQIISYGGINLQVDKGDYYTFSAYIKNTNKIRLSLSYLNKDGQNIEVESEIINSNDNFERHDITIFYPDDAASNLSVKLHVEEVGTAYIDDIQLEPGEVANNYNLLENSDFSDGFSDWTLSCNDFITNESLTVNDKFEIISLSDGTKALKAKMNPAYTLNMEKTFNICGNGGDVFNISCWYKNEGFLSYEYMESGSLFSINFNYVNTDDGHCGLPFPTFNPNDESWQYVSNQFVAEKDYKLITVSISHCFNANDFYITNMCLFKDIRNIYYEYDENGNIVNENGLDNENNIFSYDKNNQLIKMMTPKGKSFELEYDNIISDRIINGISDMGVSNEIKYDNNNNPTLIRNIKNNIIGDITDDIYRIRLKGLDKYLINSYNQLEIKTKDGFSDLWKLEKNGDYFKIHHSILIDKYFTVENNMLLLSNYDEDKSLFKLNKNENGSYSIKLKSDDKYLKYNDLSIECASFVANDYHFEFYFETTDSDIFMESSATYTDNGKFISSTTDSLGNVSNYDINLVNGLMNSENDANGNITNYIYNDKKQLICAISGDKKVEYEYNDKNLLSKVKHGSKEYIFVYDEFSNIKTIKIGNNITLVTNYYDSNGDLISFDYGNNSSINYEYDEFYRLRKKQNDTDTYNYKYDCIGNLAKIISENYYSKYIYDLAKRLSEYYFNEFKIKYKYDSNCNIINIKYNLEEISNEILNEFNDSDLITKTSFNDHSINYDYDPLCRVYNTNIDGLFNTYYKYLSNGKNTSALVKELILGNEKYSYKYNKLGKITHVYHDNKLEKKYYYDNYNQLTKEKNYILNEYVKYRYDNVGNILSKQIYKLDTYRFIKQEKYEYSNSHWEDQLTKFNDQSITYDAIGNPLTIGNFVQLNWVNGRELSSYNDGINTISYKYDADGLRISKTKNGIETKYYLEGCDVVFEKTGNNVLYYLRNNVEGLIGFKYNDNIYYYIKNMQKDIIGILDNDCNIVARYDYDSWGNIVSITDGGR